jgi:CPA2 family monovalent cation:H+ antiporter-2
MVELTFLRDLAIVMAISAATTVLFHLLRQPVVLGYIVAGVIIGPHTPPFSYVTDLHSIHTLAELGVLLLLFSIGLEFDLRKLSRVGGVAFLAAILEILLMVWLGYSAGRLLGWGKMNSLFLGALLSISSTTIIVQVLMETGQLRELFAQIILGILIVEDIVAIIILVILSSLATAGTVTFVEVGWALLRVSGFMVAALLLGYLVIPRLITFVAGFNRTEMLTITVLGLAFGLAVLGAYFGFSIALGAFLMGAIMAESETVNQIVERVGPIREMFTAVFFVATGMLLDPKILADLWGVVLFITMITVVGKIISCAFGTFLAGYGQVALPVGLGMAQIGEFSFIIANLGRTSGVTGPELYPIAVIVSSVTTFLTPYLLRSAPVVTALFGRFSPRPLVTFATFYTAWLSRLTDRTSGSRTVRSLSLRLIFYLALTVALFVATWSGVRTLVEKLPVIVGRQTELLQWGIAALVVLPLLFIIGRTLETLTQEVMASLLRQSKAANARQAGLVRNSLRFIFAWIAALFVLAAGTPVLPPLAPLVIVVCGLLAATFFFWESLVRFHTRIEGLLTSLGSAASDTEQRTNTSQWQGRLEVTRLLSDQYGPEVQTEDFVVPFHSTALNQTIQTLGLRTLTGASIIAIYRDPDQILVPRTDTVILPGDVLLLLGDREQLEAALHQLTQLCKQKTVPTATRPQIATAVIAAESPLSGLTLAETGFRDELGVLVVGVRRGEEQITNPGPGFRVQPDDILYLWGPPEQIEQARRRSGLQ